MNGGDKIYNLLTKKRENFYKDITSNGELFSLINNKIESENIKFIRLQFVDINGSIKSLAISPLKFQKVVDEGVMFDGSSVEGYARIQESDMMLKPELMTFCILPWGDSTKKTARVICDVYEAEGDKPFQGDPRYVLKKAISDMKNQLGKHMVFNTGPEIEFYLLRKGENGFRPHDEGTYFDYSPLDLAEDIRRDTALAMINMGINFEVEHHEVGKGQHEIDFEFGDALHIADQVITSKIIVKTIARKYNTKATFMPKPFKNEAGNAMHVNQSISNFKDKNLFSDEGDLSSLAYYYMGGIMEHAHALTAITNPTVNSYKRLVPGYEAPVFVTWGRRDRSSLIRIPAANDSTRRIELRTPDASCNPYLAFAVMLAAGLDGIKKKRDPGDETDGSKYYADEKKRMADGIRTLPRDLNEAMSALSKDDVIKKALGKIAFKEFINSYSYDWKEYTKEISPWEFNRYINV